MLVQTDMSLARLDLVLTDKQHQPDLLAEKPMSSGFVSTSQNDQEVKKKWIKTVLKPKTDVKVAFVCWGQLQESKDLKDVAMMAVFLLDRYLFIYLFSHIYLMYSRLCSFKN